MLTLDIGSTCLKAQVFDEKGNILFYRAAECALTEFDGTQTADIDAITETVILLTREAAKTGWMKTTASCMLLCCTRTNAAKGKPKF